MTFTEIHGNLFDRKLEEIVFQEIMLVVQV